MFAPSRHRGETRGHEVQAVGSLPDRRAYPAVPGLFAAGRWTTGDGARDGGHGTAPERAGRWRRRATGGLHEADCLDAGADDGACRGDEAGVWDDGTVGVAVSRCARRERPGIPAKSCATAVVIADMWWSTTESILRCD
jgi:hypothetical protein